MWGSDASLGVINLITKDGRDIDGHVASVNYATEDNHTQVNILSGREFDMGEYMLSVTYVQDKESIHSSEDIHVELSHHADLSDDMALAAKLTAKQIDYARDNVVETGTNHGSDFIYDPGDPNDVVKEPVHDRTEIFPEQGIGLEFLLDWDINEKNKFLAGARARVVEAGPGKYKRFNIDTGLPPAPESGIEARKVLYEETTDYTYGAYVEDACKATDSLTSTCGVSPQSATRYCSI